MSLSKMYFVSLALLIGGLIATLCLGLLPALISGFIIYFLIEFGSRLFLRFGVQHPSVRMSLLIVIAVAVLSLLAIGGISSIAFISHGKESLAGLLQRIADIVSAASNYLPLWAHDYLPSDVEEWQKAVSAWLRDNAGYLSGIGKNAGILLLHILFGMIIGGLIAVTPPRETPGILSRSLTNRMRVLGMAFRRIVFSQFKISALNTTLTALFLGIVLPLTGNHLPFLKTMIAVTFIVGLLPVIGNLISNSIIFLIALSVSPVAAIAAIVFLIVIHKLEYFFNAQIIGVHINSHAWEILLAMLVMEALFGLSGVIAAPIYYAYLKSELAAQKLI